MLLRSEVRALALVGVSFSLTVGCGSDVTETNGDPSGSGGSGASGGGTTSTGGMNAGGDSAGGASAGGANAGGMGGAGACGDIGAPCSGTCPGNLVCYTGGQAGFCIPASTDCGGFAGAMCGAQTPVCMTLTGADFGPCGTETVKQCVCSQSPNALADC